MKVKLCIVIGSVFFLFIGFSALGQTGCIGNNIPFQTNGTMYTSRNSDGSYQLYGAKVVAPENSFCLNSTGSSCVIRGLISYSGSEVSYGPLPCPVDSKLLFPLMAGVIFAALRMRFSSPK